jgi:hypothetical protein
MATVNIRTAAIQYGTDIVECHCEMNVMTPAGPVMVVKVVSLNEPTELGSPDWTDADLCLAVATQLDIDPADVAIAGAS